MWQPRFSLSACPLGFRESPVLEARFLRVQDFAYCRMLHKSGGLVSEENPSQIVRDVGLGLDTASLGNPTGVRIGTREARKCL